MRKFRITVEGTAYDVTVEELDEGGSAPAPAAAPAAPPPAAAQPVPSRATPAPSTTASAPTPQQPPAGGSGPGDVVSPLAGTVQKVDVSLGESVTEGQTVVTLEAMKMLTTVVAPRPGSVKEIRVQAGSSVQEGQVLVVLG
ncbi:biotin/lipoyl-containing protein [Caenispirillum salinarum]|uniref:biotin/lipoyl-containing protein n=1 Tax=Caenispirillum salinarum TaxID=859058 RepID=UPI00384EC6DE